MKYLFQHYEWDFEDCIVGHCKTFEESQVYDEGHDGDLHTVGGIYDNVDDNNDDDNLEPINHPVIDNGKNAVDPNQNEQNLMKIVMTMVFQW